MGLAGDRVTRPALLLASVTGTMMGAVLLWWSPAAWVGAVGLLIMGLYLAPVFPVLVLITADAMGPAHAPRVVGYQIAAAGVGAAAIPGLIGALVGAGGIEVTGPLIAGTSVALLVAGAAVIRLTIWRAEPAGSG
jgi:fucose permease